MEISNLRIEHRVEGWSHLVADVKANYTTNHELWVSVPSEYESWLSDDVYDAFAVAAIYPAMYYNEDIEIKGAISPRLYFNLKNYVPYIIKSYRPNMHFVDIRVTKFETACQNQTHVATGFSGGVDSFATIYDRYEKETDLAVRIDSLLLFNVGSYGGG